MTKFNLSDNARELLGRIVKTYGLETMLETLLDECPDTPQTRSLKRWLQGWHKFHKRKQTQRYDVIDASGRIGSVFFDRNSAYEFARAHMALSGETARVRNITKAQPVLLKPIKPC